MYDINQVLNHLEILLEDLIDEFDVILPIARRGIDVIRLSTKSDHLFKSKRILFYESIFTDIDFLRDKRIVIFDEAVSKGSGLTKRRDQLYHTLAKKGLKPEILTSALIVKGLPETKKPDIYLPELVCNENLYNFISDELMKRILSTGTPLDIDHILIPLQLLDQKGDFSTIMEETFDSFNILPHSRVFGGCEMFSIDFRKNGYKTPDIGKFPKIFDGLGPKKIRIFKKRDKITAFPVSFPIMKINQKKTDSCKKCEFQNSKLAISLCQILQNSEDDSVDNIKAKNMICYSCLLLNINLDFISYFLRRVKENTQIEVGKVDETSLIPFYPRDSTNICSKINKRLDHYNEGIFENNDQAPVIKDVPVTVPKILVSDLEPYIINTAIVHINKDINSDRFEHHRYPIRLDQSPGLTYHQIVDVTKKFVSLKDAYGGMDVALDIGTLSPRTAFEGMKFKHHDEFTGVCRLYSLTGEMKETMNEFTPLIMEW